jgi:SAM-dependent methyltransferase
LCGTGRLQLALPLEHTPLGDHFVGAERLDQVQEAYPLDLMLCEDCGNVQLQHVVNPEIIYRDYTYTSSVSLGLVEHFQRYADAVLQRVDPRPNVLVVEIGSNEGAMLRAFQKRGLTTLGVDPAREIARCATAAGIETLPCYFTAEVAQTIRDQRGPAAIVIANNVIANIDDLSEVMRGLETLLAPQGVFVFETSYCLDVVQDALLDTIFHEHLTYFSVRPLVPFFRRHGMELIDAQRVATKGGSLRVTAQRAGGSRPVASSVAELQELEASAGLNRLETYRTLAARLDHRKRELHDVLGSWKAQGKTIAAYGAAVGLTTMIYQFGLGKFLSFIVDDNPGKHNLYSPGLHLPTLPSEALYQRKPDYVVVLAWRYVDSILQQHQAFLAQGGQFVTPLPEIRVIHGG